MPTPNQFAAALGKICRYGGRAAFWSVLLHSFVVADLVEPQYRLWALTHDIVERQTGDVNTNFKSAEMRHAEDRLLDEAYDRLEIPRMTHAGHRAVKVADIRSRAGEIWSGVGDTALRKTYPTRDREAERLTLKYFRKYKPADTINPKGRAVKEFCRRFKAYKKELA